MIAAIHGFNATVNILIKSISCSRHVADLLSAECQGEAWKHFHQQMFLVPRCDCSV